LRMEHGRATEVAARVGQGMALLFGILGLLANPMLLLIAFFVWMGAQQESSLVRLKAALQGLPVRSAMITEFHTLAPNEPLGRAAELMLAGFQHDFPVVVDRGPIGLLTRDDVVRGLADGGKESPVMQFMHTDFSTSEESQLLEDALGRLSEHEVASQLVLSDGRVVGILTPENIGELVVMHTAMEAAESPTTFWLARRRHAT
jgi:CBS domain-containing protein